MDFFGGAILGGVIYDVVKTKANDYLEQLKGVLKHQLLSDEERELIFKDIENATEEDKSSKEKFIEYIENQPNSKKILKKAENRKLTKLPFSELCIGRENDLVHIEKTLKSSDSLLLLNGIGGIGKTTLAKEYIKEYIGLYDHIAYVEHKDDIKSSFISSFSPHYEFKSKNLDEKFNELIYYLGTKSGNNLLVVDNLQSQKELNEIKDICTNYKLLITSRIKFKDIENYHIDILSSKKAKELFLKSYNTNENIDKLLEYIGYHTLFITLTAQALSNNDTLSIEKLETKFKNGEFGDISNLDDDFEEIKFNSYLQELFFANNLKDEDKLILKRLSLFPSMDIDYKDLKEFLCIKEDDEQSFSLTLNKLSRTGWLIKDNTTYKLHQIIKQFIVDEYKVNYEESKEIVQFFIDKLYLEPEDNPIDKFKYLIYLSTIDSILKDKNKKIATLYNNISLIYQDMGELEKAIEYQKKALELREEILGKKHPDLATSYNNISLIYKAMGELEKAIEYQRKALELREEILGKKHPDLATSYNNISLIYKAMGELEKAIEYQRKALELKEKILGEKHPSLATSYNNISMIYQAMGELEKALEYQKKTMELFEEILDDKHPSLATSYNNISLIYQDMGEIEKAIEYQRKDLEITKEILGEKHPDLAISYNNISVIYLQKGELGEAKTHIDKAVALYSELFPNGHPHLDISLNIQKQIENSL